MDEDHGDLKSLFASTFALAAPIVARARASGRVNLIGEHTDYSEGYVLPMAIPQRTNVMLAPTADRTVRTVRGVSDASDVKGSSATFVIGQEQKRGSWIDYVQGTVVALRHAGQDLPSGFDFAVTSEVPIGAGLSSSAALEVALLRALRTAFSLNLDDLTIAKIGRAAETDFVGAPIGIMDQMVIALTGNERGERGERDERDEQAALFIDTRSLTYECIPIPSSIEIVVIDSGVKHDHATGDYATRRAETEAAAKLLNVAMLRDVLALESTETLPEPLRRRARHVVSENKRVLEAVSYLRSSDADNGGPAALGKLLIASHASLRDDFEVSVEPVDHLVALANADPDCFGARMTGGGFGGAIIALTKRGTAQSVARRVVAEASRRQQTTPYTPRILVAGGDQVHYSHTGGGSISRS